MATAYTTGASKMATGTQPKMLVPGVNEVFSTFNLANNAPASASGFAINDTINFMKLGSDAADPPGFGPTIGTVVLAVPPLDTSTGIVTAVGDDSSGSFVANYITGATVGRSSAGGVQGTNVYGGVGFQPFVGAFASYTTVSLQTCNVIMKVTTAATGTAATTGIITLRVSYIMDT